MMQMKSQTIPKILAMFYFKREKKITLDGRITTHEGPRMRNK